MTRINQTVLMSGVDYFDDGQAINPFMTQSEPINLEKARAEHLQIQEALKSAGVTVVTVDPPAGCQDGVYTANWAEREDGTRDFSMAMQKVETALAEKGATRPADRTARFVSVLCLAWPDGHTEMFRGEIEGTVVWPPRGDKGFGYDPVFQPENHEITFGEMSADEKHGWKPGDAEALSHRARAFKRFVESCLEA